MIVNSHVYYGSHSIFLMFNPKRTMLNRSINLLSYASLNNNPAIVSYYRARWPAVYTFFSINVPLYNFIPDVQRRTYNYTAFLAPLVDFYENAVQQSINRLLSSYWA